MTLLSHAANWTLRLVSGSTSFMGNKLTIAIVLLLLAGIAVFVFLRVKGIEITITQAMIDESLEKNFPKTTKVLKIFEVTYSDPEVDLLEADDRIQVGMKAKVGTSGGLLKQTFSGSVILTSGLRFGAESKEFFLNDPVIESLNLEGIPSSFLDQAAQALTLAAQQFFAETPVYKLEATNAKMAVATTVLKNFEVSDQAIQVTLGL